MTDTGGTHTASAGHISVLGSIQCAGKSGRAPVRAGQCATLAAWLVAHRNESQTIGKLEALVWSDPISAPHDPRRELRRLLRQVRSALEAVPDVHVDITATSVTLEAPPERIDAEVFAELVLVTRVQPTPDAVAALNSALQAWRGDPYPELQDQLEAVPVVRHLLDLRREALARVHAIRAVGPPDHTLVADLTALVSRDPDDDRFWRLLALSLYRTGRRAEALRAIQECRRRIPDRREPAWSMVASLEDIVLRDDPMPLGSWEILVL